jgi:uncharacterized membrane protein
VSTRDKKDRRSITLSPNGTLPPGGQVLHASYQRLSILPPPSELERYEALHPGTTKILLDTYQKQVEHRIKIEENVIEGDTRRANIGQVMAFILSLVTIMGGFTLVALGKDVLGISAILGSLATLVGVFVYGAHTRRKERENKSKR